MTHNCSVMRIKVTWALVALVAITYFTIGLAVYGAVHVGWLDKDALKYLFGALVGSGVTAPLPIMSWFKEKKITFDLSDSDPPTPNNTGEKKP